jgi:hypothetical protein
MAIKFFVPAFLFVFFKLIAAQNTAIVADTSFKIINADSLSPSKKTNQIQDTLKQKDRAKSYEQQRKEQYVLTRAGLGESFLGGTAYKIPAYTFNFGFHKMQIGLPYVGHIGTVFRNRGNLLINKNIFGEGEMKPSINLGYLYFPEYGKEFGDFHIVGFAISKMVSFITLNSSYEYQYRKSDSITHGAPKELFEMTAILGLKKKILVDVFVGFDRIINETEKKNVFNGGIHYWSKRFETKLGFSNNKVDWDLSFSLKMFNCYRPNSGVSLRPAVS